MNEKNYYNILGISKNASDDDIKKAYRKLAHKYHPDKNGGDDKKFKEISEAYQILSNGEKRSQYDRFGRVFDGFAGGNQQSGFGNFGDGAEFGFDFKNFEDLGNISEIFDMFFGGLGGKKRKTYKRGSDLEVIQEITLEEAYKGVEKKLKIKTFIVCQKCSGLGHFPEEGLKDCSACNGRGEVKETRNTIFGNFSQIRSCAKCLGGGQIPNRVCVVCSASGRIRGEKDIAVSIASGVADGQLIKISKAGEKGEHGAESGDLYVRVKVKPHQVFARFNNDLIVKREISLIDVLLNKKIELFAIGGKKLEVEIPSNFNLKEKLIVSGEGMPILGGFGRGNLLIELEIKTARKLSAKAKKLLEELDEEFDD